MGRPWFLAGVEVLVLAPANPQVNHTDWQIVYGINAADPCVISGHRLGQSDESMGWMMDPARRGGSTWWT